MKGRGYAMDTDAEREKYHANIWESIGHLFGKHLYPEYDENIPHGNIQCVICYKDKL